jgi:hypothetical protein
MTVPSRSRRIATVSLAYGAVLALCALYAYWDIFSQWLPYDDTGFNTYAIRLFMNGHALYDQIFSPYGPFGYELWGGLFTALGVSPSTDASYLVTCVLWLGASLLIGLSAHRLSGRLAVGIITMVLSFQLLAAATHEPLLPDLLATLLLITLEALCIFGLRRQPTVTLGTAGALIGILALTKVNSGTFAFVAVAYTAIMALAQLRQITLLRRGAMAAVILIAPVLMVPDLHTGAYAKFAFLVACSALALVLANGLAGLGTAIPGEARLWVRSLVIGLVVSAAVILGVIFVLGTSPRALFDTLILNGPRQRLEDPLPVTVRGWVDLWAVAGVIAAWLVSRTSVGRAAITPPSTAVALGRILCGAVIWYALLKGDSFNVPFNLPLAWVAAVPSSRDDDTAASRFVRLLIPTVAVVNSLFVYPVAGSQMGFAAAIFVLCGAVCVADGLSDLRVCAERGDRRGLWSPLVRTVITAVTVILAVALSIAHIAKPLKGLKASYEHGSALPFAGATRVHLAPEVTSTLSDLVTAARSHCRTLISVPNLPSLNLWSGLPQPSGLTAIGLWWKAPSSEDLATAYAQARAAPGPCEVRNEKEIIFWVGREPLPQIPLVRFLAEDFTPIGTFGNSTQGSRYLYTLLKRKESSG